MISESDRAQTEPDSHSESLPDDEQHLLQGARSRPANYNQLETFILSGPGRAAAIQVPGLRGGAGKVTRTRIGQKMDVSSLSTSVWLSRTPHSSSETAMH